MPIYTIISNAAVCNIIYVVKNYNVNCIANSCILNLAQLDIIHYKLPANDTKLSKHART